MALHWDLTAVANRETVCWHEAEEEGGEVHMKALTNTLIFLTMAIGMGSITKKNYQEFFKRIRFQEKLSGPYLRSEGKERFITLEDIRAHIGLRTNVSTEAIGPWLKRQYANWDIRCECGFYNMLREHECPKV